jgi:hypothetical protein
MILGIWKMIEEDVLHQFSFLQGEFYFPPFETSFWRDECYIKTRKANIEFSVYIQMESDACPSISLINHSEEVKFDNTLSPTNSYEVENLEKKNAIISSMPKYGESSIKLYIAECANILKRHPQVLSGDISLFEKKEAFTELKIQIYRRDKDGKVLKDGIRTVKSLSELSDLNTEKENYLTRLLSRIKNYFT